MNIDAASFPFAMNLKSARLRSGLSAAAVARKAGLDTKTVFRIEAGENLPRIDTANVLALAVGSTLDELLERPAPEENHGAGAPLPGHTSSAVTGG